MEGSGSLTDNNRSRLVKRVLPHCKAEEVRVMDLEIFHVSDPFADQPGIRTLDIGCEMAFVGWGQCGQVTPCFQLFGQVAERKDKVRE
jgi:hypothetical protein